MVSAPLAPQDVSTVLQILSALHALFQQPTTTMDLATVLVVSSSPPHPSDIARNVPTTPLLAPASPKHSPAIPTSPSQLDSASVQQEDSSILLDSACPVSVDAPLATAPHHAKHVLFLLSSKETSVSLDADQDTIKMDSSALLVHQDVPAASDPTSASSVSQEDSATTDFAMTTALLDQSSATHPLVLIVTHPAPPALNTQANALPANHAAATYSTSNVLKAVQ